jgi:hypothetical protein
MPWTPCRQPGPHPEARSAEPGHPLAGLPPAPETLRLHPVAWSAASRRRRGRSRRRGSSCRLPSRRSAGRPCSTARARRSLSSLRCASAVRAFMISVRKSGCIVLFPPGIGISWPSAGRSDLAPRSARRTWTTLECRPSPRPVTDGPGRRARSCGSDAHRRCRALIGLEAGQHERVCLG